MSSRKLRTRSATTPPSSARPRVKKRKTEKQLDFQRSSTKTALPKLQTALLLHAIRQPYRTSTESELPEVLHDHELLIKVNAAGLNPIDWKAP